MPPKRNRKRPESSDEDSDYLSPQDLLTLLHSAVNQRQENETRPRPTKRHCAQDTHSEAPSPPIAPTDLDALIELCILCKDERYRDCTGLDRLLVPLQDLRDLVGLDEVKQAIVDFVVLHMQASKIQMPELRHLIIAGPPGCGKTTVSKILARIMASIGVCDTDRIVYGTQGNMIGGFLGQTAPKTEAVVRSAFGGVLVIDEASSLADGRNPANSDSFSKSCIDTLNRMLSEHGDKFVCILAGYKTEIHRDILSINPGMSRRFNTRFEIKPYTPAQIHQIILRQLAQRGVTLDGTVAVAWVKENRRAFSDTGGSCLSLVNDIMMVHARRVFGDACKNTLTQADLDGGMKTFLQKYRERTKEQEIPESVRLLYN